MNSVLKNMTKPDDRNNAMTDTCHEAYPQAVNCLMNTDASLRLITNDILLIALEGLARGIVQCPNFSAIDEPVPAVGT